MKREILLILALSLGFMFLQRHEPNVTKAETELSFMQDSPDMNDVVFDLVIVDTYMAYDKVNVSPYVIAVPSVKDGYMVIDDKPPVMNAGKLQSNKDKKTKWVSKFDYSSNKLLTQKPFKAA